MISFDTPCLVSGFKRVSLDDSNGDGEFDPNEPATVEFVQCKDSVLSASVTLDALTIVRDSGTQQHSTRLDGPMQMRVTASSETLGTFRLTASAPVTVTVATPVFADTVTLHAGFLLEATGDTARRRPPAARLRVR